MTSEYVHDSYFLVSDRVKGKQFSTFIETFSRHGDDTMRRGFKTRMFESRVAEAPELARLIRNYQRKQWDALTDGARRGLFDDVVDSLDSDKSRALTLIGLMLHAIEPFMASDAHQAFMRRYATRTRTSG